MNLLTLDGETSISNKGNPYDLTNIADCFGFLSSSDFKTNRGYPTYYSLIDLRSNPQKDCVDRMQKLVDQSDLIIGFNLKFDMTWLRRLGVSFKGKRLWDVQLCEFLLSNQQNTYPSLNETAAKYGLGQKLDVVKTEYWDKGIDTPDIPEYILHPYLEQDVNLTWQCYMKQLTLLKPSQRVLLSLQNQDLEILAEMEWNGLKFDFEKSKELGDAVLKDIEQIDKRLCEIFPSIPVNYGSTDHLSACLFGGIIKEQYQEPIGTYKTGTRKGEVKYGWKEKHHSMPRLLDPGPATEILDTSKLSDVEVLEKKGYRVYSVSESNLKSLKAKGLAKELIDLILTRSEKNKLVSTYYHGLPQKAKEFNWEPDYIHGQFNQVVARTGRLSSSNPNMQNQPPEMDALIITRF